MILHVLTASPEHAQLLLRCGLQAGFRESGAINLVPSAAIAASEGQATPMVAIRSAGLAFESLVGFCRPGTGVNDGDAVGRIRCTVSPAYLRTLVRLANARFVENARRIERFLDALAEATGASPGERAGERWEDAQVRKERKKAEGLQRREELRRQQRECKRDGDAITIVPKDAGVEDMTLGVGFT
ncbi:methyltransferase TYW3-domain-containing protein [Durotheca rogersii]|uniref:methyltransferase TYW3-domain-containing protein n=1 Tax=Durotheca rogersii TaxID=419775 RepID=UPI00221EFB45|nr:methyltransferase TYW3-domain-containing protein [Durotheca rogersii]KAI5860758.1 methyltransferase TYW3-domain-containing protein [Durotheca rogersii]